METLADEIKKLYIKRSGERDIFKTKVTDLDSEIRKLVRSYKELTGEDLVKKDRNRPVLDYVEDILKKHGDLHINSILEALRNAGHHVPKQSVAAGLIRYHNQQKRFKRVAPNTFALRKKEEEREREK